MFLYRSKYITEKEHRDYINNIVQPSTHKEKPASVAVKRATVSEPSDDKQQKLLYLEERLRFHASTLSPSLNRFVE